jgi:hypothetical protein
MGEKISFAEHFKPYFIVCNNTIMKGLFYGLSRKRTGLSLGFPGIFECELMPWISISLGNVMPIPFLN